MSIVKEAVSLFVARSITTNVCKPSEVSIYQSDIPLQFRVAHDMFVSEYAIVTSVL